MYPVELTTYQKQAVDYFVTSREKRILFGLPTGVGKTIILLSILKLVREEKPNANILVICPANLRDNLISTNLKQKWNLPLYVALSVDRIHIPDTVPIISFHLLGRYAHTLSQIKWDLVVVDEIHYAKNPQTSFSKGLALLSRNTEYLIGFTASYVANKLEELIQLLSYFIVSPNEATILKQIKSVEDLSKHKQMLRKYLFIISVKEIKKVVRRPSATIRKILVTLTKDETQLYNLLEAKLPENVKKKLLSKLVDVSIRDIPKNWFVAAQQLLLFPKYISKFTEGAPKISVAVGSKILACIKQINTDPTKKRIIFVPYVQWGVKALEKVFNKVNIPCVSYHGELSTEEKQKAIETYTQSTNVNTIILSASGKEGINLPGTQEIHFLGYLWNPEDIIQIIGRALRLTSPVEKVIVYFYEAVKYTSWFERVKQYILPGNKVVKHSYRTIDSYMLETLNKKIGLKIRVTQILGTTARKDNKHTISSNVGRIFELDGTMTTSNIGYYENPKEPLILRTPYPPLGSSELNTPGLVGNRILARIKRKRNRYRTYSALRTDT